MGSKQEDIFFFASSREVVESVEMMFDVGLFDLFNKQEAYFGGVCVIEIASNYEPTGFTIRATYGDKVDIFKIMEELKRERIPENLFLVCQTVLLPFVVSSDERQDNYGDKKAEAEFLPFIAEV